jgi:hypothetical protein
MMQFGKMTVRDEAAEKMLEEIGQILRESCPPGFRFSLLVFSFGEGGSMFYASNADRESMCRAMQEFIEKFRPN